MIFTIVIFLIVLSILVFVHELGHFLVAKRSGMKVHEFGFGFPPRIFGIQKTSAEEGGKWKIVWGNRTKSDETVYSINYIPLGGFVKIEGEDNDSVGEQSFVNKSFWPRFLTLVAGVVMNFVLACLLLSIGFMAGLPVAVNDISEIPKGATFTNEHVVILEIQPDSIASKAGLEPSDIINNIDGQTFQSIENVQSYIKERKGQELSFDVQRVNEQKTVKVKTSEDPNAIVGIGLAIYGKAKFAFFPAIYEGTKTAFDQLKSIATGLFALFSRGDGIESLGGPVKIAQLTGQVADMGIIPLLQFSAFLSLNLALLNALPFPALDGGRIFFLLIETVRRKKNNPKIEQYANAIGFMVLLLLMLVISVRDVSQLEVVRHLFK